MGTQAYRANYREAFQCANEQLGDILHQYHQLQLRKDQLQNALSALEPFLQSNRAASSEYAPEAEPIQAEPVYAPEPEPTPEPVMHAVKLPVAPEPAVAPSYAPVSEANVDPIQARINRALGLAVA
jgi:hypothetical protein